MCLEITARVQPGAIGDAAARSISEQSGLVLTLENDDVIQFSKEPGCSCSMLSDQADWSDSFWHLDPAVLPRLEQAIRMIAGHATEFQFSAYWFLDRPRRARRVRLEELVDDLKANRVSNGETYEVAG